MFVAKLDVHRKGYGPLSNDPESWECPMCGFNIYPDTDPGWIRCEVRTHLFMVHNVDLSKIKIRRRKQKKDKVKSHVRT